jgi:hypothetical protein
VSGANTKFVEVFSAMRRRAVFVAVALALTTEVASSASPVIHVRGAARIDATASLFDGTVFVTGTVTDDTGRPVGGATLELRATATDGSTVPLPPLGACPDRPNTAPASAGSGPRPTRPLGSDASGRFCATLVVEHASALVLAFVDPRGLFDAAEQRVVVDAARRGVDLRFAPTTATFELERETQRLQVSTHVLGTGPGLTPPLALAVYLSTPKGETLVGQGACPVDGATELELSSKKIGSPGPLELVLRFAGTPSLQPAEARRRVLATAQVRLGLGRAPGAADPADGIPLELAVGSAAGAVDGGAVEARLAGQTVGIAPVEHGAAHLVTQFPRRADTAKLELRYLPVEPWWRPGVALGVDVKLLSRARWVSLGWLSALGAIAAWLLWGWRRPAREPEARPATEARAPVAGLHLVKREDNQPGWRGVVRDAHDEVPIPRAVVSLVSRVPERRVIARTVADEGGRFELVGSVDGELELAVSATWHTDFSGRAPAHGELRVDLVSRRRYLVGRLVGWAERRAPGSRTRAEPTPGDVKRQGRRARRDEVVAWAAAVESAAFGPEPVDEKIEREVSRLEPPERVDPAAHAPKRDH